MASGRSVLAVARESYALTLYTYWHVERAAWREEQVRRAERFDLAGLFTVGARDPEQLGRMLSAHISDVGAARQARPDPAETARHVAAHRRMIPVDPPPEG